MISYNQSNIEGRLCLAVNALDSGQIQSIRAAARIYTVPPETLRTRYHGTLSRRDTRQLMHKLTSTEEEVLLQRILSLDAQGFPPRISIVRDIANIILTSREMTPPLTVGKNWPTNFVKRCPQLRTTYNRKYDYQQAQCEDPVVIQGWFNLVRNMI